MYSTVYNGTILYVYKQLNLISTVMTFYQNKVTPVGSTSTMVCNAVISLEILLIFEQNDIALWQMYTFAMHFSPDYVLHPLSVLGVTR
jgi:hypothetical protein